MNINHVEPTKYIPSLTEHSVAYREYLVYHGYAKSTVQHCEEVVARFSRWMLEMCHRLCDINETLIEEFLHQRVPDHVDPVSGYRRNHSRSPLVHLLVVLRATDSIQAKIIDMTSVAVELRRFDDFLRQARGFAQSTRDNSTRIIGRFLRERFDDGAIELSVITPMHVRNFLTLQASIYRTPTSFSMVVSSLRGYFRWRMMQANDLHALIGALANPANWSQASLPKSLRVEEVEQLLTSLGRTDPIGLRADAMVRCALDLGLRIGEIARLNLDDIDWENGTITLRRTKGHRDDVMPLSEIINIRVIDVVLDGSACVHLKGKGRRKRSIPLWKSTVGAIRAWLRTNPNMHGDVALLPGRSGQAMTRANVTQRLALAVNRAAVIQPSLKTKRVSPHILRHTTAMHLLQNGVSFNLIALWLGHESVNTTHRYVEANLQMKEEVLSRLEAPDIAFKRFRASDDLLKFLKML